MLESGRTLSHYRLVAKIGEGGMGEVWKAKDGRLDREVALKVLPGVVAGDPARLERFAREAKLLASLNHPGIATIFDVDDHEGVRFLVMELVDGDDLSQTLERGLLPLDHALDVALQIARAVEAAHGQGVVHRDLKPANVKQTPDGQVKVLDFGLAKAVDPGPASGETNVALSPTMTSAGTVAGMILGTAAYMSPEQARGRPIDKRTDVWSFGVLVFELLTGDNPFRGDTVADSVGAIMHRDPDLDLLPSQTPAGVRRMLRRCLARERSDRLHDIADARIELEEAIANPEIEHPVVAATAVAAPPSKLPWIALALLVPLAAASAWWIGSRQDPPPPQPTRRFELASDVEVDEVALSPDGTRIAYGVGKQLFIRSLDSLDARLVDDSGSVREIFWSPDGRSLGVSDGSEIKRIDLDGGAPTILSTSDTFTGLTTWGDDGFIYFVEFQSGIHRMADSGGAFEEVLDAHPDMLDYHGMALLPGGRGFLTLPHLQDGEYRKIFLDRPGEDPRVVFESDSLINGLRYSATGHILFQREDNPRGLWALPFSLRRLATTGAPFLVVPDLEGASFSRNGDMAYTQAALQSGKRQQRLVWADRSGAIVERLDMALYGARGGIVSPDGKQVAVGARGIGQPSTDKLNFWAIDLERGTSTKLTEGHVVPSPPTWSADGSRLAFVSEATAPGGSQFLASVRTDGTGDRQPLVDADMTFFGVLSPDWSWSVFMTGSVGEDNGFALAAQRPGDASTLRTFVDGPGQDVSPAIHPSGRWVAYMAGNFRNMDTFVRPFPEGDGQWKVSVGRGGGPFWSVDGRRLFYVRSDDDDSDHLMEVAFDGSGERPVLGTPVELFSPPTSTVSVAPDGRFVFVVDEEPAEGEDIPDTKGIVLVQNWLTRFVD